MFRRLAHPASCATLRDEPASARYPVRRPLRFALHRQPVRELPPSLSTCLQEHLYSEFEPPYIVSAGNEVEALRCPEKTLW